MEAVVEKGVRYAPNAIHFRTTERFRSTIGVLSVCNALSAISPLTMHSSFAAAPPCGSFALQKGAYRR